MTSKPSQSTVEGTALQSTLALSTSLPITSKSTSASSLIETSEFSSKETYQTTLTVFIAKSTSAPASQSTSCLPHPSMSSCLAHPRRAV